MKKTVILLIAVCAFISPGSFAISEDYIQTASDGASWDTFGWSVDISGSIAIASAPGDDDGGTSSGSAYLFDTSTGNELFKLTAGDGAPYDNFGWSVGISGNYAVVGSNYDDDGGSASGSAYLFDVTTGQQIHKLTANDASPGDFLGKSVAISNNTVIAGSNTNDALGANSGAAYVFDGITGQQTRKLTASDGANQDQFGQSVAMSGDLAIIGAQCNNDNGYQSGSAYLFDINTGEELFKLTASDAKAQDWFGYSVDIDGTTAIVGSYSFGNDEDMGAAYLFDVTTGEELFKLLPEDGVVSDNFGYSVTISGDLALVGTYSAEAAYLFDVTTGEQIAKIVSSNFGTFEYFGRSLCLNGLTAVIGASDSDVLVEDHGGVYVYTVPEPMTLSLLALGGLALRKRK